MQDMGADIPKIAVMPQNKRDVLILLSATEEMVQITLTDQSSQCQWQAQVL